MLDAIRSRIRDIPDFPKKGIIFKDITPLLADGPLFHATIEAMVQPWRGERIQKVIGIESRGFVFAAPLALALGVGLIIVRKPGKLPWKVVKEQYALEYGSDTLELHEDALSHGERALVVDDVLATGGTAAAVGRLVQRLGGQLAGYSFLSELAFLQGSRKLGDVKVHALLQF
ncbi:MAG TPA: adenine phosphoribosyltransferase [Myxococcales bacterium]|nr:adenine phosphoribosyltransferase [Myxococcales bacterium]